MTYKHYSIFNPNTDKDDKLLQVEIHVIFDKNGIESN